MGHAFTRIDVGPSQETEAREIRDPRGCLYKKDSVAQ